MLPFRPRPRVKTRTPSDMKFKVLVEGFLIYIIMNSVIVQICGSEDDF